MNMSIIDDNDDFDPLACYVFLFLFRVHLLNLKVIMRLKIMKMK